jgi:hypothetical protein
MATFLTGMECDNQHWESISKRTVSSRVVAGTMVDEEECVTGLGLHNEKLQSQSDTSVGRGVPFSKAKTMAHGIYVENTDVYDSRPWPPFSSKAK